VDRTSRTALHRRAFLKLLAATSAAGALPALPGCVSLRAASSQPEAAHFFTPEERAAMEALGEAILPEGATVGARGAGAIEYIDRFLAAFDNPVPTLFRGGPFSGRTPYPDPETGAPSQRFPENDFLEIVPPTRLQELSFRILLYGSQSVPDGDRNAPIVPTWPGLRTLYRQGIAALERAATSAGAPGFAALDAEARLQAFDASEAAFQEAFLNHLAEGMFCPPEYGGNQNGVAWRDYHYDGDSQPLGHTLYDRRSQTLYERADQPSQSLDPALPNDGLGPEALAMVDSLVAAIGGRRFY
jgi:hypothetical protein